MKKKILILLLMAQMMPDSVLAQNDDLYFVPREKKEVKRSKPVQVNVNHNTYYCGSSRDVDEYNRRPARRMRRNLVKVGTDSLGNDVFEFRCLNDSSVCDSSFMRRGRAIDVDDNNYDGYEDYRYTRRMRRFDGYRGGEECEDYCDSYGYGYNQGYVDGLTSWNINFGWYDPWWYTSRYYGWSGWYNNFYFGWRSPWYGGWYDPWFGGWYDPWWGGGYYPVYHRYYAGGYSGTRNHSRGAYSKRRYGTYNSHSSRNTYNRNRDGFNSRNNRGFGNNRSWNNRNNRPFNNNRHTFDNGGFGGSRSHSGGFGGGRSGGGSRSHGRFGGGR